MGKWFYDKDEQPEAVSSGSRHAYMFKNKKTEQFMVIAIIPGLAIRYTIMTPEAEC